MGEIIKKQHPEIKKHIAAIHCYNSLTLLQRKISNALLYHAYPDLMQKEEYEITIKQLCNIIGYSGNNHSVIKDALKALISCVVEWNITDEHTGEEDWTASAIIASASIKGSRCLYAYSPRMRALLYSPSVYGKINLIVQSKFRSSYGLALYENCVRYKGLASTKCFDITAFRKLMGVPNDKYDAFKDFKKRVIDKSVEEVNNYSELIIEPEINRQGHKVISIRFKLKEKEKKNWLGKQLSKTNKLEILSSSLELKNKLIDIYGFNQNTVLKLLNQYPEETILEKMVLIERSNSFQKGKILSLAQYLTQALKENYKPAGTCKTHIDKSYGLLYRDESDINKVNIREEELKKKYSDYIREIIDMILVRLPNEKLESMQEEFKQSLIEDKDEFTLAKFNKQGLNNKIVKAIFRSFVREKYDFLCENVQTFGQYKTGLATL